MRGLLAAAVAVLFIPTAIASSYENRWVFIFGWGLRKDSDVEEIERVFETAEQADFNGAVLSAGLDSFSRQSPDYFRRLDAVVESAERHGLELIPLIFSAGYGGSILSHNPNLAEGFPVEDAPFLVQGNEASFLPDTNVRIANGDFEQFEGMRFDGFQFHDKPGVVSFPDTNVAHGGRASIRFENFGADENRHGRVMQEVAVTPRRAYRASLWVKTEAFRPNGALRLLILAGERTLGSRRIQIEPTSDWQKVSVFFNSLTFDTVRLYAGVWGGREGKVWLDDWTLQEVGPINVLHRPGTPVTVRGEDGRVYEEGRDYAPLEDPDFNLYRYDRPAATLRILDGGRIRDGERLRVSWYHPIVIGGSQVTICLAEPEVYEIWDREAGLLWERLHPKRFLLSMDEIRAGGSDAACRDRNLGELLGEAITKQVAILRRYNPDAEVYIWPDMLDPNHNAHANYYLAEGDFTGSWEHVPEDLIMAVWGRRPRADSLRFFADRGFRTLIAGYYDADTVEDVEGWLRLAQESPNVQGFMYTTWRRRYDLLPQVGALLNDR